MVDSIIQGTQSDVISRKLRSLRQRCHMSMRGLAERAGVAPSYVAGVEAGRISPTIATFRKLLLVLGTDLAEFFSDQIEEEQGYVFRRESMSTVVDATRCYTLILPRRSDLKAEVLDEELSPGENPEFETITSDLMGYVLKGDFIIELQGDEPKTLRTGDAFYIPAGRAHRGYCAGDESVRLLTIWVPPSY